MATSTPDTALLDILLKTMEEEIVPRTERAVARGNKVFGAALLRKVDYALIIAGTNNEIENPLWHGEIHTLKRFYELPAASRPPSS